MDLLKMDDKKLLDKVVKNFTKAENAKSIYEKEWKDNYRLYKSKLKEQRDGANLFIPYTWATVEQLKARALQTLFSNTPYVGFAGNGRDDIDGAELMEKLVYYQMKEKIKLPFKFIEALNSVYVYGTAIALRQWKLEEKTISKKQNIFDEETGIKTDVSIEEQVIKVYDDPDVEFIPIDDFFPDPEGWDIKTCAYACTRAEKDLEYLKQKEKEGIYKLPDTIENDSGDPITNFRDEINGISKNEEKSKTHELISYYTDDVKIVVLNKKHIICKEENELYTKEKPFERIVAFPQEKEFWGMAVVSVLKCLQEELNSTRNQRIDNVSLILNKVFKMRNGADIDPADVKSKAGHIIPVNDMNDIQVFDFPDVTGSAYQEEQIIKQDIQYISAVSEYSRGATPQRKETATTVTTIQEASNVVFNYIIMVLEITGLLPLADAIKKLNQQYVTESKVIRLFDSATGQWDYPEITPDSIQGDYDVVSTSPRMEAQTTKENKRQQMLDMFNMFTSNELTKPYVNAQEFMKKILDSYDIKDYEKLIQEPVPPNPIVQDGEIPTEEPLVQQEIPPVNMGVQNGY